MISSSLKHNLLEGGQLDMLVVRISPFNRYESKGSTTTNSLANTHMSTGDSMANACVRANRKIKYLEKEKEKKSRCPYVAGLLEE